MQTDLISIIVPVYNVEKYLSKCIQSILKQTYKNFEVILIEDGSPDNCDKLCDYYAKIDSRVKVIHKQNEGVSKARNDGIRSASGEYLTFIDSDDWISENYLEALYALRNKTDADLVSASYYIVKRRGKEKRVYDYQEYVRENIGEKLYEIYHKIDSPWGKLFRKKLIVDHDIYFDSSIPNGEDIIFDLHYMRYCNKVVIFPDIIYYYNCTVTSSATKKYYPEFDKYRMCIFNEAKKTILDKMHDQAKANILISEFARELCGHSLFHYLFYESNKNNLTIKINKILDYYTKYINVEDLLECKYHKNEILMLKQKNVPKFIKLWRKRNWIKYYKHQLRILVLSVVGKGNEIKKLKV